MVANVVSSVSRISILGLCSVLLPCMGLASRILPPEDNPLAKDVLDPSLLEQTEDMDMQEFLGNLLSVLNLTDRGSPWAPGPPRPPAPRVEPPEYMLELYNRFANDHSARPTGNTVRSFKNEGIFTCTFKNGSYLSGDKSLSCQNIHCTKYHFHRTISYKP